MCSIIYAKIVELCTFTPIQVILIKLRFFAASPHAHILPILGIVSVF